jgi:ABC-type dipeptide/oligopeptide/nickel transport systems, permease components
VVRLGRAAFLQDEGPLTVARYLTVRLGQGVLTLLLASMVVFVGVRALPGDPAPALAGEEADPATVAAVRVQLGSLVALSVPHFWLGLVAILYLAVGLGWFPASGYTPITEHPLRALWQLTLPRSSWAPASPPCSCARPARR